MRTGRPATDFILFPAGPADAQALGQLHVATWRETYRGLLPRAYLNGLSATASAKRFEAQLLEPAAGAFILAAADHTGLVGYAEAGLSRSGASGEAEIYTLYLLRAAQGHGLGGRMVADAARALAAQDAQSLVISVLVLNAAARGFYEHLGGKDDPGPRPGVDQAMTREVTYRWPDIRELTR